MATEPRSERDPWTRVKDHGELREGMAIRLLNCRACGKTETAVLRELHPDATCVTCGRVGPSWEDIGGCQVSIGLCWCGAIREGRVYRLADDQLADDAKPATVVRDREMERAR